MKNSWQFLRTCFVYFFPLVKRWFLLCWNRKFRPKAEFFVLNNSQNGNSFLQVKAILQNVLLINVNGRYFLIQHDDVELTLSIPNTKNFEKTFLNGVGVFYRTKRTILDSANNDLVKFNSLSFDRSGHFKVKVKDLSSLKIAARLQPRLNVVLPSLKDFRFGIKESSNVSTKLPKIKLREFKESELRHQLNQLL